jgi:hypothetical protein
MRRSSRCILCLVALATAFAVNPAWANLASDIASNAAYDDGWQTGDDGGTGFGSWTLSSAGFSGLFMGNSLNLDSGNPGPGADINTSSRSFGLFAQGFDVDFDFAEATRLLDAPLSLGEAFSLELAVNFRNGNKGVDIRTAGGAMLFNFNVGGDDYVVNNAATGNGSIGSAYHENTEFKLTFTQTTASGGTWSIERNGGVTDLDVGTYTGVIGSFKLYVNETDFNSPNDLYANSFFITAVPEASAVWLGALASVVSGLAWCWRRRRS